MSVRKCQRAYCVDDGLLSDVMHGPGSKAQMKLKKAYDSLVCGGLVVIQEFLLNDRKAGPLIPALFNVMVGAYSQAELFGIVEETGFIKPKLVISSEELGASLSAQVLAWLVPPSRDRLT